MDVEVPCNEFSRKFTKIPVGHTVIKSLFASTAEKLVLKNTQVLCKLID